jgi:predicted Ser/Thr protein kinase
MIGELIDHYRVLELVGRGAMGVVYKALDLTLDRTVAIKVMSAEARNDPDFVERFRQEARLQAALNHPNVALLFDYFVHEGAPVVVMEFIDGESLEQLIHRRGPIPARESIPIFKQALRGVAAAHRAGIIHRDLKPSNLMVTTDGVVKVMDFGIAKRQGVTGATKVSSTSIGSPLYMAPEQILGRAVDCRTDIYALGITLYELLSGQRPFNTRGKAEYLVLDAHVNELPEPPTVYRYGIPQPIVDAVMRSLAKEPDARFQSAEDFMHALPDVSAPSAAAPPMDSSGTVAIPPVDSSGRVATPLVGPTGTVATPRLGPTGTVATPRLGPTGTVATPRLGPTGTVATPRLGPTGTVATPRLGPTGTVATPRVGPTGTVATPRVDPSGTVALEYSPSMSEDATREPGGTMVFEYASSTRREPQDTMAFDYSAATVGRQLYPPRSAPAPVPAATAAPTVTAKVAPSSPAPSPAAHGLRGIPPVLIQRLRAGRPLIAAVLVATLVLGALGQHAKRLRATLRDTSHAPASAQTQTPTSTEPTTPPPAVPRSGVEPAAAPSADVSGATAAPATGPTLATTTAPTRQDLSGTWRGEYVDASGKRLLRVVSLSISRVRDDGGIEGTLQYEAASGDGECKLHPRGSTYSAGQQRLQLSPEGCSPRYPKELGVPLDFDRVNPQANTLKDGRIEAPSGEVIRVKLKRVGGV